MGKPKRERSLPETAAKAVARNLRVSPQKLNLVAGLIRGKKVNAALADLEFSRKRVAQDVRKCVMSAVANAENNHGLDVDELVVSEAYVGKNMVLKRFHARGRGRSAGILKPFSQITVVVRELRDDGQAGDQTEAKAETAAKED
jgi:large subunit ribosomal protein L22